jgi:predicted O-linked N-acetylglucosamine transferase (SPINDLY family)
MEEACASFASAVELEPKNPDARSQYAQALDLTGRYAEAIVQLRRAIKQSPREMGPQISLALLLKRTGEFAGAIQLFKGILSKYPDQFECHYNLAEIYARQDQKLLALDHFDRAVKIRPKDAGLRNGIGNLLRALKRPAEALDQYNEAIRLDPTSHIPCYNQGLALRGIGKFREAQKSFDEAWRKNPQFLEAKLASCMANLQPIYESAEDADACRINYSKSLMDLAQRFMELGYPASLAEAIGSHQPFYLPYQQGNDKALQANYGEIAVQAMARKHSVALPRSRKDASSPIRVGFVSGFFREHSNWRMPIKGWISQLDLARHEIYGYYTGDQSDGETALVVARCFKFVQGLRSLDEWRQLILEDHLDVLIYPEIGMDKLASQLAAQRLAPVQCCSWGHPVTSGFSTIDFFLSSDLMEPADAQEHYTETLIRLPNLSVFCERPPPISAVAGREKYNIRADAIAFWCCQSLPKYAPIYDDIFPRIAAQLPNCQFVFIEFPDSPYLTESFLKRLEVVFSRYGLEAPNHCVMLPRLPADEFRAAMGLFDVMLDSVGWSGCNSTFDALTHNLPIITIDGEFMRGRHTSAILNMMNMGDAVAADVPHYVEKAVMLGLNKSVRSEFSARMALNKHLVYEDKACIRGLEEFLLSVTGKVTESV